MGERNNTVPADRRIEFRVGINIGDIIIEDEDIFGDGVNVAARLEALADPGGICVSRVVRDQVRNKLDFAFQDHARSRSRTSHARRISIASPSPRVLG
jgi:adenylate cyclase